MTQETRSGIFKKIVEKYCGRISDSIRGRVPESDRDDVYQDVMLSIWATIPKLRYFNGFSSFVYTVTKHRIADYYRRMELGIKPVQITGDVPEPRKERESQKAKAIRTVALSKTELEILGRVGNGWSNDQISQLRYISMNTVRTHLKHIHKKLGTKGRVELALFSKSFFNGELK